MILPSEAMEKAGVFIWGQIGEKMKGVDEDRMLTLGLSRPEALVYLMSVGDHVKLLRVARDDIRKIKAQKIPGHIKRAMVRERAERFLEDLRRIRTADALFLGYAKDLQDVDPVSRGSAVLGEVSGDMGDLGFWEKDPGEGIGQMEAQVGEEDHEAEEDRDGEE